MKAARIRLVGSDVDGVLTDGGMYYGVDGEVLKRFNARDGMGVALLRNAGIEVVLLTGEDTLIVEKRAAKLHIAELHQGVYDKRTVLANIASARGLSPEAVAFIGDDVNDLNALSYCGLSATVADGADVVKENVDLVTGKPGGCGAFREFADFILESQVL